MIRISFVTFIALVTATSGLLFGFDTGVIADTQWQLSQAFAFTSLEWSLIVSAMILGAFLGALFSGKLSDILGRKNTLLFTAVLFIISTLLVAAGQGFISLFIGRFLLGISIGIASYSAPLFIAEIAPSHLRGRFVLFNSVAITGGEAFSFLVGYVLHETFDDSWRLMFLLGLLPAIFLLMGLRFVPQSPRWLVKNNKIQEAKTILEKIRDGDIKEELSDIRKTLHQQEEGSYQALFKKPYRKLVLLGCFLGVLQQCCGINVIMYYGPYVFNNAGFTKSNSLLATFAMGMVNMIFTFLALLLIDRVGRRKLLIGGSAVAGFSLLILSSTFVSSINHWIAFVTIFIFCMSFAVSLGCCFWLIISELYPLHLRVQAMSIATSMQWLANFIVSICFLPLFEKIGGAGTMLIFSFFCFSSTIFSMLFIPETKGIALEKIEENLMKGFRLRELGVASE